MNKEDFKWNSDSMNFQSLVFDRYLNQFLFLTLIEKNVSWCI